MPPTPGAEAVPILVTGATNVDNWYQSRPRALAKRVLDRGCGELASANLAISGVEAELLRSGDYPRVHNLPLAVDVPFFTPPADNERDPGLLLTIAHLNPVSLARKGVMSAVATLAQVRERDTRLVIVGEDQGSRASIERYAAELGVGDRVIFTGSIDRAAKRSLLWQAAAYLQISRNEGFGVAVAEAMAARCPVVVTPLEVLTEVAGQSAFAYVTSPADAARAVDDLQRDPERRALAAHLAFLRVQREFDYSVRSRRLQVILGQLGLDHGEGGTG